MDRLSFIWKACVTLFRKQGSAALAKVDKFWVDSSLDLKIAIVIFIFTSMGVNWAAWLSLAGPGYGKDTTFHWVTQPFYVFMLFYLLGNSKEVPRSFVGSLLISLPVSYGVIERGAFFAKVLQDIAFDVLKIHHNYGHAVHATICGIHYVLIGLLIYAAHKPQKTLGAMTLPITYAIGLLLLLTGRSSDNQDVPAQPAVSIQAC